MRNQRSRLAGTYQLDSINSSQTNKKSNNDGEKGRNTDSNRNVPTEQKHLENTDPTSSPPSSSPVKDVNVFHCVERFLKHIQADQEMRESVLRKFRARRTLEDDQVKEKSSKVRHTLS